MATPRSPYVCIGDSLLDEPWPFEIKAALGFLSCHIHIRWRTDRRLTLESACINHPISMPDLQKITGKRRDDAALRSLRHLADVASISIRYQGDVVWIDWPKWSEYNKVHSRSQAPPRPRPRPRPQEEEELPSGGAPREPLPTPPVAPPPEKNAWSWLAPIIASTTRGVKPEPEADEREAWLASLWPEIEGTAMSEAPPGSTIEQIYPRMKSLACARWRKYLQGERQFLGIAKREDRDRRLAEYLAQQAPHKARALEEEEMLRNTKGAVAQ